MERTKAILSNISELFKKEKLEEAKKREEGDFFNVFNTIGLWSEEVRLHSSFIAELLNPKTLLIGDIVHRTSLNV